MFPFCRKLEEVVTFKIAENAEGLSMVWLNDFLYYSQKGKENLLFSVLCHPCMTRCERGRLLPGGGQDLTPNWPPLCTSSDELVLTNSWTHHSPVCSASANRSLSPLGG